jgi:hypothetical protein
MCEWKRDWQEEEEEEGGGGKTDVGIFKYRRPFFVTFRSRFAVFFQKESKTHRHVW